MASSVSPDDIEFLVPMPTEGVFKDECAFCFDSPESPCGLFICVLCHVGFCKRHLQLHAETKKHSAYLNYCRERKEILAAGEDGGPPRQITKLAIGIEGGIMEKQYELRERWTVAVYPTLEPLNLVESTLGPGLMYCCKRLMEAESAYRVLEVQSLAGTWDGTMLKDTVHKELYQVAEPPKIPPSGWRCAAEGCDKTDGLWMNLSDGKIFCGRRYFDGTGGNNHAVEHFCNTNYPLAVKLGTISARGADVFSYDEDDLVNDPMLEAHLMHFGIDVKAMEKTEKSMIEMELDYNQKWELQEIQEEGQTLTPVHGAGLTGMVNTGNSCYLNCVMQAMLQVDAVRRVYVEGAEQIFRSCVGVPTENFNLQLAKLLTGLASGDYSKEQADSGVRPASFRLIINRGNAEFASNRQQDVEEFMRHLFDRMEQSQQQQQGSLVNKGAEDAVASWRFCLDEKLTCFESGKSSCVQRPEVILSLPVPQAETVGAVSNGDLTTECQVPASSEAKPARFRVTLAQCLQAFVEPELLDNFTSPFTGKKSAVTKELRFNTFPDYFWIQIKKFTFAADWRPMKLDVSVDVPDVLDLNAYRSTGPHFGKLYIEDVSPAAQEEQSVKPDAVIAQQLLDMGFALPQVERALVESKNNVERAVQWLLNCPVQAAETTAPSTDVVQEEPQRKNQFVNGDGVYQLCGFISHIGKSTHTGHYVCHLLKNGRWVMFNDEKVVQSEKPPKDLGYIYLYRRVGVDADAGIV